MALVTDAYMTVTLSLRDRDNNYSSLSLKLPAATTLAQAQTFISGSLITLVNAISNAVVAGWSIAIGAIDTDPTLAAVEASDVQRKAIFTFKAANGTPTKVELPSIDNAFVVDFTNQVDLTTTEVTDFVDLVINGDGTVAPVSNAGSSISLFVNAKKVHRASNKG